MVHFNASRVQFSLRDADTGSGLSLITRARAVTSVQVAWDQATER